MYTKVVKSDIKKVENPSEGTCADCQKTKPLVGQIDQDGKTLQICWPCVQVRLEGLKID